MKLKMFGKNSVSAVLFWIVLLCLMFVLIHFIGFLPELVQNENIPFFLNVLPVFGYLALLIPLALILNTLRKEKIFTKQSIKYLNLFVVLNLVTFIINAIMMFSVFHVEFIEALSGLSLHIVLIIFAVFITSIFKQGFKVQQENELTI